MTPATRPSVRAIARRAVQAELVAVAQRLFDQRGYDETSVDEIATAAGMSRRTFFRYFDSKEDLVLGKYDLLGDVLLEAIRSRPDDEPLWEALRAMFDTAGGGAAAELPVHAIERVVDESPSLRAGFLYRLEVIQRSIAAEARARAERTGDPYAADDPAPEALVGAAFACMIAARDTFQGPTTPWPTLVERAMKVVHPGERPLAGKSSGRPSAH